jgi:CO/xanthine dehydrogenase FAD-binding subunit
LHDEGRVRDVNLPPFDYACPATLSEAVALLASPDAKALAGGQSLVPMLQAKATVKARRPSARPG